MAFFQHLRNIYTLDALDTRFTTSSTTPLRIASDPKSSARKQNASQTLRGPQPQPSKWLTPEYLVYWGFVIVCVPLMFYTAYDVSKATAPNYHKFEHRLQDGWLFGRKVDNSDMQYSGFRGNIPYSLGLLVLQPTLRKLWNLVSSTKTSATSGGGHKHKESGKEAFTSAEADARFEQRVSFDFAFAMIFLTALHGASILKVLGILYVNFKIATGLKAEYIPIVTWAFNMGTLFANELCRGYPFAAAAAMIEPEGSKGALTAWAGWLDHFGLMPRWEILFNITVLRLISFNMDYYWSLDWRAANALEVCGIEEIAMPKSDLLKKKQLDPANLSERDRVSTPASPSHYSLRNYIAYALYAPLYLTGPIITFNDYVAQNRYPSPTLSRSRTIVYGIRFLLAFFCMEIMLHFIYAVAISKSSPDWSSYTPLQLSMLGYFNLHIIWLKLLLPWRFFRLWSLVDGIDPPENMVRCMSNNYSALAFWRGWHRSYNRWIVRYIYIPLGGSGQGTSKFRAIINFLTVFTFVALWHDISMHLLMWGWLISLFVLPEVLATLAFPARKWRDRPNAYRWLCGIGASGNILMMMAANLVGFAVGVDGLVEMAKGIAGSWSGVGFLLSCCVVLFVGAQIMFEVREGELRAGIRLKC